MELRVAASSVGSILNANHAGQALLGTLVEFTFFDRWCLGVKFAVGPKFLGVVFAETEVADASRPSAVSFATEFVSEPLPSSLLPPGKFAMEVTSCVSPKGVSGLERLIDAMRNFSIERGANGAATERSKDDQEGVTLDGCG